MSPLLATTLVVLIVLAAVGFGPAIADRLRGRGPRQRRRTVRRLPVYDPRRERQAEARARELMRSIVGPDEHAMYEELGFVRVLRSGDGDRGATYGYLLYPHRPIVAYDPATGELLSEYCVRFPDRDDADAARLPDADDVLAKWMVLHGDERGLIEEANMHLPGRHHHPAHLRRDLARLAEWEARRPAAAA
ncbi:MAG TPA: hypothetical protein VHI76_06150 [Solirubrobacterales bacterium]|jgi:hypothetical protein|nr:hypothetical protein [Solirubrobacterales bacterium]